MSGRVAGKVALVTGAARGIGRACAIRLAEEGADVALLDIGAAVATVPYPAAHHTQVNEVADEIRALGRRCQAFTADVRDGEAVRRVMEETVTTFGGLDVVIAAAGIDSWGRPGSSRTPSGRRCSTST